MAPGSPIGYRSDPTGRLCGACGRATRSDSSRTVSLLTTDPSKSFFQSTLRTKHPRDTCMALTDFPGGGKFGRESPKGGLCWLLVASVGLNWPVRTLKLSLAP